MQQSKTNKIVIAILPLALGTAIAWIALIPLIPMELPFPDFAVALAFGVVLKLFVMLRNLDAKKMRHGKEHGSAKWSTAAEIAPFIDPDPKNNMILTKTESMSLSPRMANPEHNRNKNILVVGGSGSGKTRFFVKPNLMQCESNDFPVSFVVTDPKGTVVEECGDMLVKKGYKIKVLNTIDMSKSSKFNPFKYITGSNDQETQSNISVFVNTLMSSTKKEGTSGGEQFWQDATKLLYTALVTLMEYTYDKKDRKMKTLLDLIGSMDVKEEDENYKCDVTLEFDMIAEQIQMVDEDMGINSEKLAELLAAKGYTPQQLDEITAKTKNYKPEELEKFIAENKIDKEAFTAYKRAKKLEKVALPKENINGARQAVAIFNDYKKAAGKTAKSILISCAASLIDYHNVAVQALMSDDEMDIEKLGGYHSLKPKPKMERVIDPKTKKPVHVIKTKKAKRFKKYLPGFLGKIQKIIDRHFPKTVRVKEPKMKIAKDMSGKIIPEKDKHGKIIMEKTVVKEKHAYFIIISDMDTTFNFLATFFYSLMFINLSNKALIEFGGALPVHVRCILDEFANIGVIPEFEKKIAVIRSREISACVILQSQAQLKGLYKDHAATIIGNMDTYLYLGGGEKETLKDIVELLGKETIDMYNTSKTLGQSESHGQNYQKTGRELMAIDELAAMPRSECILRITGVRPFKSKKYDITLHHNYKMLSDADKNLIFDIEKYKYAQRLAEEEKERKRRKKIEAQRKKRLQAEAAAEAEEAEKERIKQLEIIEKSNEYFAGVENILSQHMNTFIMAVNVAKPA